VRPIADTTFVALALAAMSQFNLSETIRAMAADPEYRAALTVQLQTRTIDPALLDDLIAYARSRATTMGHAITRKVLTDAGISWEAL
jgi:hypothetical protein